MKKGFGVLFLVLISMTSMGQLRLSSFAIHAIDSGSYAAGVENASGVYSNARFKLTKGTVMKVTPGSGLAGDVITDSGTISLPDTGTAGTYGDSAHVPRITTDAKGRVVAVTTQAVPVPDTTNKIETRYHAGITYIKWTDTASVMASKAWANSVFCPLSRTLTFLGTTFSFATNMVLQTPTFAQVTASGATSSTPVNFGVNTRFYIDSNYLRHYAGGVLDLEINQNVLRMYNGGSSYYNQVIATIPTGNRLTYFPDRSGTVMMNEQWGSGTATMVLGTKTVIDANCTASSVITLTRTAIGGTPGAIPVVVAGSGSFTITIYTTAAAVQTLDTSTFNYLIKY